MTQGGAVGDLPWVIRPTADDDVPGIVSLVASVADEDPDRFGWMVGRGAVEEHLRLNDLQTTGGLSLTVEACGAVAGRLVIDRQISGEATQVGEVSVLVAEHLRRRGVGCALVNAGSAWARAHKIDLLSVRVLPDNDVAIRVYRRCGFVDAGAETVSVGAAGPILDVLIMRLPL